MTRSLGVLLSVCCLASCATGDGDLDVNAPWDASSARDSSAAEGAVDGTAEAGEAGAADAAAVDSSAVDSALDAAPVDTGALDSTVVDSAPADTGKSDTAVADTYVADTYVADTFVADTYVADTYVADTGPVDAAGCTGVVVDWNWNTGTGPTTTLVTSGKTWKVGAATSGPSDGQPYLATIASGSLYPNSANDWVRLPTIDLAAYKTCKIKVTVALWRNAEKYGLVNYDGGNLQYATDTAATAWTVMDGGGMGYDGKLQCSACLMATQNTWTSSASPFAKTGTFTSAAGALGSALNLRFTFYSDEAGQLPGIFVKSLKVEAVP